MGSIVNIVIPPLVQAFSYRLAPELEGRVAAGARIEVPFGKRKASGFVVKTQNESEFSSSAGFELKTITAPARFHGAFHPSQLPFFEWIASYYGDSLSNVIDVAVPHAVGAKVEKTVELVALEAEAKGKLQTAILDLLRSRSGSVSYTEMTRRIRGAGAALQALEKRGVVVIHRRETFESHLEDSEPPAWAKREVRLNPHQQAAFDTLIPAVDAHEHRTFLIHGVTGSGKTEVYIEAIRHARSRGLGSLVIVPEIALTPQLVDRFRARLGNELALLHSGLSKRTRWDAWRALLEQRGFVAIGARSAVFAPVPNLGLIIVDEEHDGSYKQSEGLRYNARDLAVLRGKFEECPVVLGSATPSLESLHRVREKKYQYLSLPGRPEGSSAVSAEIVDLNRIKPWDMPSKNISPALHQALDETLKQGSQAFILYNRRGFATYLQCERCETVIGCPNCSVTLTYHRHNNSLLCHYCGLSTVPSEFCPHCPVSSPEPSVEAPIDQRGPGKLALRGGGTERVFEEIQELFPGAVVDRLDRDAVTDIEVYRTILDRMRDGSTQVLVGTQMIAKGHDLPNVTLVGVVDCDVGLHMPDFRSGERVFQLLTQAAGRAGRAERAGRVILQTRVPTHESLRCTVRGDYLAFAARELENRRSLSYPPFARLLRIVASALDKNLALEALVEMQRRLRAFAEKEEGQPLVILGPAPSPLARIKALWRFHLLLKSSSSVVLNRAMMVARNACGKRSRVRVVFDMDPQELL